MDEAGARIVAHAAASESQCGIAERERVHTRNPDVDGVCLQVEAIPGDAGGAGAKELVTPRGPITTDDLDLGTRMADRVR
jgi:hypothetical protein